MQRAVPATALRLTRNSAPEMQCSESARASPSVLWARSTVAVIADGTCRPPASFWLRARPRRVDHPQQSWHHWLLADIHRSLRNATDRGQDAELERLLKLGARTVDVGRSGEESWRCLADPRATSSLSCEPA